MYPMSKSILTLALAGAWLMTGVAAAVPPPPDLPAPRLVPEPGLQQCRNAFGGRVTRKVGNLQQGPGRAIGMPRIEVRLLDSHGALVARTRTNQEGGYGFSRLCPGSYQVCAGTPCPTGPMLPSRFAPGLQAVKIPPWLQRGIDFELLEPPPVPQLPEP